MSKRSRIGDQTMKTQRRSFWAGLARILAGFSFALTILSHAGMARAQMGPYTFNVLDSWSFLNGFEDDYGVPPLDYSNVVNLPGPDGNALMVDTNVTAYYNFQIYMDGSTNLIPNSGTISFWVNPYWSSSSTNGGAGPGDEARFVDVGSFSTNASIGWWSIRTDDGGTNIYFEGQNGAGGQATYICYPISWASNTWVSVAISYSPTNSTLFLNGITMTNGLGVSYYPDTNVLAEGLWFGSDDEGSNQMDGLIAGIETLNMPVNSNVVASLIIQPSFAYTDGNAFNLLSSAASNPSAELNVPDVFTGSGFLTTISTSSCPNATNEYDVWITNVVTQRVVSGTNVTMDVTFTIGGGSNGVPYDVFASSILSGGETNPVTWGWQGQGYTCDTYELTNIPNNVTNYAAFVILGTPLSYDNDGLTAAYQYLVSHTNPHVDDQDGAGIPDGWQVLLGLNPLVNQVAQPSTRSTYTYDTADRLTGISGVKPTSSVGLDNEGNVTSVSQ
jgi:hypothetical protein